MLKRSDDVGAHVLYIDHQGHPAPITECFHATASRRLSSTIDRIHRPSTITQVDSAYCPQCLTYHDVITANNELLGYCNKVICKRCPTCFASCKIEESDSKKKFNYYSCGAAGCDWNSKESLFATSVDELDKKQRLMLLANLMLEQEPKQQQTATKTKPTTSGSKPTSPATNIGLHYNSVIETWERELLNKEGKKGGHIRSTEIKQQQQQQPDLVESSWSLEALEETLQKRKDFQSNYIHHQHNTIGGSSENNHIKLKRVILDDEHIPSSTYCNHSCLEDQSIISLTMSSLTTLQPLPIPNNLDSTQTQQQQQSSLNYYYSKPLPIPLRVRKSRRCRAELAEGRPGILIKPKLNPLEGDSSLRTGHGQWWKKDSSAIHVLPRMKCVKRYFSHRNNARVFLLNVTNPTLGIVKLRLSPISSYAGEQTWESSSTTSTTNSISGAADDNKSSITTTTLFENLVLDSLWNQKVNVQLLTINAQLFLSTIEQITTSTTTSSPIVELDSAEDAFVDFGKSKKMPQEVLEWIQEMEQMDQAENEEEDERRGPLLPQINLIAPSSSSSSTGIAWFECIVPNNMTNTAAKSDGSWWNAFAISMQIQVGNGSWEASLIKPKKNTTAEKDKEETEEEENVDWVSFDLLITWPPEASEPKEEQEEESKQ